MKRFTVAVTGFGVAASFAVTAFAQSAPSMGIVVKIGGPTRADPSLQVRAIKVQRNVGGLADLGL